MGLYMYMFGYVKQFNLHRFSKVRTIFSILEIILASTLRCPSDIFDDDDDDGDDDGDDDDVDYHDVVVLIMITIKIIIIIATMIKAMIKM